MFWESRTLEILTALDNNLTVLEVCTENATSTDHVTKALVLQKNGTNPDSQKMTKISCLTHVIYTNRENDEQLVSKSIIRHINDDGATKYVVLRWYGYPFDDNVLEPTHRL